MPIYSRIVNIIRTINIRIKKIITDFCKESLLIEPIVHILQFPGKKYNIIVVRLLGFEPRTSWSVAKRSIQLSYRRNLHLFFVNQIIIEEK